MFPGVSDVRDGGGYCQGLENAFIHRAAASSQAEESPIGAVRCRFYGNFFERSVWSEAHNTDEMNALS